MLAFSNEGKKVPAPSLLVTVFMLTDLEQGFQIFSVKKNQIETIFSFAGHTVLCTALNSADVVPKQPQHKINGCDCPSRESFVSGHWNVILNNFQKIICKIFLGHQNAKTNLLKGTKLLGLAVKHGFNPDLQQWGSQNLVGGRQVPRRTVKSMEGQTTPPPQSPRLEVSGWGSRNSISNEFPGDTDDAASLHFENPGLG